MTRPCADLPQSEEEIDEFLAAFEACTLPKHRWTHAAHLLTGACYVHSFGESGALDRMRRHVRIYNLSVGGRNTATSGYHETVTVFWITLLKLLREAHPGLARRDFAQTAVEQFADHRGVLATFYSYDVLASTAARAAWIPPDRQAL